MTAQFKLPALPYEYNALEPFISEQIMRLHHSKHHQAYVTNLNAALESQSSALRNNDLSTQLHNQAAINFHGGGHINHTLFWANLTPAKSTAPKITDSSAPKLSKAIDARWGNVEKFKTAFGAVLMAIKGSGWGWLVEDVESGSLEIVTTRDQDIVARGKKPIFGVDMWEHAYYLQYLNDKAGYVAGIWNILNWEVAEERFVGDVGSVFGELGELKASI